MSHSATGRGTSPIYHRFPVFASRPPPSFHKKNRRLRRVAALPPNSGYKAQVADWQSQAFLASRVGRPAPALGGSLKNGALESLYGEFKTARENADPEVLREKRLTIDETAKKWGITPRQVRNYCAKGGKQMAVNLDTLSISLDRFDAVSDGEYNIGHIKLTGKQMLNTRKNRERVLDEITAVLSRNRYDPEMAVQNAKLEGIDDDEIEGNLNIDAIEGEV